ncbi:MAG: hypothetical protein ACLR99_13900 [Acutalibacteraceae bacterium]
MEKVKCPFCGHEQSVFCSSNAQCRGLWVKCKARHCGKIFEIKLPEEKLNPVDRNP